MVLKDPLDALFIKGDEVNRELLGDVLSKYVRLDETGRVFPLTSFYPESNRNKLLILLLARKAIALKTGFEEAIAPSEIRKLIDMPVGSINPTLRYLAETKIADDENGEYKIFSHAVPRCAELLKKKDDFNGIQISKEGETGTLQISMKDAIEDIMRQGGIDEQKTAREIYEMVLRRRPKTGYNSLYGVIRHLVQDKLLSRKLNGDMWTYKREIK